MVRNIDMCLPLTADEIHKGNVKARFLSLQLKAIKLNKPVIVMGNFKRWVCIWADGKYQDQRTREALRWVCSANAKIRLEGKV